MSANPFRKYVCSECVKQLKVRSGKRWRASAWRTACRSASTTSRSTRPLRVGIVGSGPAGFYAAARLLQKNEHAIVDMYEQLPAPFGLVRYGVAPDHPEVKNCQDKFEEVASSPRFNFIGNVMVGEDLSLRSMKPHYDALLFAYGASRDRALGIPGENLPGVLSARAFVGWYNGLPEYAGLQPDLQADDTAYIIGNGNVALDVARILLSDLDILRKTDISEQAVETLSESRVKHVHICGRRGPMQAAFTIKEVRELMNLPGVGFESINEELLPQTQWISTLSRLEQRKYRLPALWSQGSKTPLSASDRTWSLRSLISPLEFLQDPRESESHLASILFGYNTYNDYSARFDPKAGIHGTEETINVPARLAFRSIGYKSSALDGLTTDLGVPFDERLGIIPNDIQGRVVTVEWDKNVRIAKPVPGCYCAGWVKRGPTGVIASTMDDAFATADAVLEDWAAGAPFLNGGTGLDPRSTSSGWQGVTVEEAPKQTQLRRRVSWNDWRVIDAAEQERGKPKGKPREKFRSATEMLQVLD